MAQVGSDDEGPAISRGDDAEVEDSPMGKTAVPAQTANDKATAVPTTPRT